MTGWWNWIVSHWLELLMLSGLGAIAFSNADTQRKIDKLQLQVEHLHKHMLRLLDPDHRD